MSLSRLLGLASALAFLPACGDSPTTTEPGLDPVASASASAANHPTGAPVVNQAEFSFTETASCMTFDMQIDVVGNDVTQSWFYPNGNLRLFKLHRRLTVTFTNLSSGFFLTQTPSQSQESEFDENGFPIREVVNGVSQKIQAGGGGRILFYHIGHWVFTFDFSVSPPVVEQTFNGHSNLGAVSGPCEALGDPAPTP